MAVPRKVAVIADSSVSRDSAREHGLRVADVTVPLQILIEGERLDDRLTAAEMAEQLAMAQASRLKVSTSRPSPGAFESAYQEAAELGFESAVVVVISSKLSGTRDSALAAAEGSPIPVSVVDSRTSGWGMARIVDLASQRAASGVLQGSPEDVTEMMEADAARLLARWDCIAALPNLNALRSGGRAPAAAAGLVKALQLKPLVTFSDGKFGGVEMARTPQAAFERALRSLGWTRGRPIDFDGPLVLETFAVTRARCEQQLEACGYDGPLRFSPLPLPLAAHLGPGSVAFSRWLPAEEMST